MMRVKRISSESGKRWGRWILLLSLVLTGLIAAALPHLVLQPGLPPPSLDEGQLSLPARDQTPVGMNMGSFSIILIVIMLAVPFLVLVIRAFMGVQLKKLLKGIWSLLWKLALAAGVIFVLGSLLLSRSNIGAPTEPPPAPKPLTAAPLGPVPAALIWVAGIVLVVVIVLAAVFMLLARRREIPPSWVEEVAHARQALLEGRDLREVIIGCYTRMAEALQEERGIERKEFMTTGEFETLLEGKGVPRDPVRRLTRLFEAARYSLREPVPGESKSAIACLDAILDDCRTAPKDGAA